MYVLEPPITMTMIATLNIVPVKSPYKRKIGIDAQIPSDATKKGSAKKETLVLAALADIKHSQTILQERISFHRLKVLHQKFEPALFSGSFLKLMVLLARLAKEKK